MDGRTSINAFPFYESTTDDWSAQLGDIGFGPAQDLQAGGVISIASVNTQRMYALVQNNSGVVLSCGMGLKFSTGFFGLKVDKCSAGVSLAGYVPASVNGSPTNTVAIGAYFWMVVQGFTSVLKTVANIAEGNQIEPSGTAGQLKANSGTGYSDVLGGTFTSTDSAGTSILTPAYANCQW